MPLASRFSVRKWILLVAGLGVLGAGGYAFYRSRVHKPTKAGAAQKPEIVAPTLESLDFQPQIQEGPLSLKDAPNVDRLLKAYKIQLKPEQLAFLEKNKFVLAPLAGTGIAETNNWDEMLNAFDRVGGDSNIEYRVPENTKLVTPDSHASSRPRSCRSRGLGSAAPTSKGRIGSRNRSPSRLGVGGPGRGFRSMTMTRMPS